MIPYFSNHPMIEYNGNVMRNIMLSCRVTKDILDKTAVYYPYTLKDGDRPTSVAFDYYGSVDYVWLVLFSNDIVDPITDWFKSQTEFDAYIEKIYGSLPAAMSTIHHYELTSDSTYPIITPTTYQYMSHEDPVRAQLVAVDTYTWETRNNEAKRTIKLISKSYAAKIALELETKMAE